MEKDSIIEGIHTLVSNNVIGDKQLLYRYIGFRGELSFEALLSSKYSFYRQMEGGIIISKNSTDSSLNNSLYLSVIPLEDYNNDYLEVFSLFAKLNFQKMYLVLYTNHWTSKPVMHYADGSVPLMVPDMEIHEFDITANTFKATSHQVSDITDFFTSVEKRNKNYHPINESTKKWLVDNLTEFDLTHLTKIYLNRLFLDGYIGFGKEKGKSSDIDMILKRPSGEYKLIEIKEKDLPKQAKKGFGLDVPRLDDLLRISRETELEYHLVVRHVNNQTERKLIGWKKIKVDDFASDVKGNAEVIGGTGMRSEHSINKTLICSYDLFRDL